MSAAAKTEVHPDFHALCARLPLVPVRNDRHLRQAYRLIDELSIIDEERLTAGQGDYLYALSVLVHDYEQMHGAVDSSDIDAVGALGFLLEQNGMTASDLGRLLGNRQLGAAILRRERQLSKANIIKLRERFKVSADLFLR
jgi:HTH-type transcriptional regulator/antitoxin HigA